LTGTPVTKFRYQVREGKRLQLPASLDSPRLRQRLLQAVSGMPFQVFTIDSRGISAGNVVGAVDIGDVQIEILPKVSAGDNYDADSQFLLDLLSTAGLTPRVARKQGQVLLTSHDVIEAIIRAFSEEVAKRLISGPPRRYHERREVSAVLRGRIEFNRLATRPPAHDHLLPVRYAPLHRDNTLSQVVRATLQRLLSLTRSARNRATIRHCLIALDVVTKKELTETFVLNVNLSRFEADWSRIVNFALALARGQSPNPVSPGLMPSYTLLFSLDDLFEAVLRKYLPVALRGTAISLLARPHNLNLLRAEDLGHEVLKLKPDYLFVDAKSSVSKRVVGDAKWKRLRPDSPSSGLKTGDVYQLTTYMMRHQLTRGILFFPKDSWMITQSEAWFRQFHVIGSDSVIYIIGVDVPGLVSHDTGTRAAALNALRQSIIEAYSSNRSTKDA
jgi:5-methylcytosine-specific restriction enzyme subunit McrC